MHETFASIIETMGGRVMGRATPSAKAPASRRPAPSFTSWAGPHGRRPEDLRAEQMSQAHDVKNLFVADAASFVSNPDKNPTLTICALSWRLSEYLAEELRKGNV